MPAAMMSNFSIYMRNDAIQTGAWVFVKEDGEYRAFGSSVSSVPDQLVYTSGGTWSMFNSSGIITQYGNTGGYEYIVNTFQPYEITISGFVQNGSVLFPNFYIAREFVDPENS